MNQNNTRVLFPKNALLRITFIAGLMLFVLTGVFLTGFYFVERGSNKTTRKQDSFSRNLREYDTSAEVYIGTEKEFENLNRELDKLEKKAISVESWLSILKRRKALARRNPPFFSYYRASIKRALKAYPSSQPLSALAAAALVKDTALNKETENDLRAFLPVLTDGDFNTLRLAFHVLLGDFKNLQTAASLPEDILSDGTEVISQDLIIMKIISQKPDIIHVDPSGEITGYNASYDIQAVINAAHPSKNFLLFAAEYNYDLGDILRAADLFSRMEGDWALGRQADCIYLAGFPTSARSLWLLLSKQAVPDERSLYNLAVTTDNTQEAATYLQKIIDIYSEAFSNSRQFALIRYSRLLPNAQALAVLEKNETLKPSAYPYIDLEICKRKSESQVPAKKIAEAWLLLDRHFEDEDLYRWSSWQMAFQREYDELNILLKRGVTENFQELNFYRSVEFMHDGNIDSAFDLFRAIPEENADWCVYANKGRILESQRSLSLALEQYAIALEKNTDKKTASKILYNCARCYTALARPSDALIALENALNLDPDNLTARLEYERLLF